MTRPRMLPVRENYRAPDTAESPLRLLRAQYAVTPFQSRDEPLREDLADPDPTAMQWLADVTAPLFLIVDYADARVDDAPATLKVMAGGS